MSCKTFRRFQNWPATGRPQRLRSYLQWRYFLARAPRIVINVAPLKKDVTGKNHTSDEGTNPGSRFCLAAKRTVKDGEGITNQMR